MPRRDLRVYSWNINGIRAAAKKGFLEWLRRGRGDIVCVQETRATLEQMDKSIRHPGRWKSHWVAAERKGYSGVGIYSRTEPDELITSLGQARFDVEGRFLLARFGALSVVSAYFPNGNGKERDNSRVPFKLDFYRRLYDLLEAERSRGARILVTGDFNTAHLPIDLARPTQNKKTSGFLPEERAELDRWLSGWIDTFRCFESGPGHYTWWSQRFGVREKNIGWRLDLILASPAVRLFLKNARIHPKVMGSDHCPISVELDRAVLEP